MSWVNDCPSVFRCDSINKPRQWIVPEEEVGRTIDYRNVREFYRDVYRRDWSPLVQAFLSDTNLSRLSRELQRRLKRTTNMNVFIELDQDTDLMTSLVDIANRNIGMEWTVQAVRNLNETFLAQAVHDATLGQRSRQRYERQVALKHGPNYNRIYGHYRNKKKNDFDMNPGYLTLTHPDSKASDELYAFQHEQLRPQPHGVLVHRPFFWT